MLIVICGLPRAGKTTYSKRFENIYPIIHMDSYYTIDEAISAIGNLNDVVIEGILSTPTTRKAVLQTYTGSKTQCIWLNTPQEIREKRENYNWACNLSFSPPTYNEGWDEIIVI